MKTFRTSAGPFRERPYYTAEEIERICEDALRATELLPPTPAPVRIERFIEKRFGVTPEYVELPSGVLGYTWFGAKGVERVAVDRVLDENGDSVSKRRIATTLAHEAGHGLLHAHLFAFEDQVRTLFGDGLDKDNPKILCRDVPLTEPASAPSARYDGRWWEYQANHAMASLLLPRTNVRECLRGILEPVGTLGIEEVPASRQPDAIMRIADAFEVNLIVARLRVESLFPAANRRQLRL